MGPDRGGAAADQRGEGMTALDELNRIAKQLPLWAYHDMRQRTRDWMGSGGEADDPYIHQQLRFAKQVMALKEKNKREEMT